MINIPTINSIMIVGISHHAFLAFSKPHASLISDLFPIFIYLTMVYVEFLKFVWFLSYFVSIGGMLVSLQLLYVRILSSAHDIASLFEDDF